MNYHEYLTDVRWGDMDALGHVNNVEYLVYFESARVELVRGLCGFGRDNDYATVVAQANITYKAPATYPAALKVVTTIPRIGNTSMTYHHVLQDRDNGRVYCEADVVAVWVSRKDNKPIAVPEFVRQWAARSPARED